MSSPDSLVSVPGIGLWVVGELDVVEHVTSGFFAGLVFLAPDPLAFEQVEETLHHSIVPAVPTSALAGEVMRTLVGIHLDLGLWFAAPDGHQQGLQW